MIILIQQDRKKYILNNNKIYCEEILKVKWYKINRTYICYVARNNLKKGFLWLTCNVVETSLQLQQASILLGNTLYHSQLQLYFQFHWLMHWQVLLHIVHVGDYLVQVQLQSYTIIIYYNKKLQKEYTAIFTKTSLQYTEPNNVSLQLGSDPHR